MNRYQRQTQTNRQSLKFFGCARAFPALSLALLVFFTSYGQHNITKFRLPDHKEADAIQVINFGDELFVGYKIQYPKPKTKPYYFYWISEGAVHEVDFPELNGKLISSITRDSLHNFFHYVEEENKLISLGTIKENRLTGKREACAPTTVEGRLIGITGNENTVFIYSFEKKTYQLKVTEKLNDRIVNERLYGLSFDLSKFKPSDIAFVPKGSVIGAAQASARVKVFVGPEDVKIIMDDPYDETALPVQNNYKTVLIDIDTKTGAVLNKIIPEMSKGNFRSFPLSKYLFRAVAFGNDFTLQMFDMEKRQFVNSKKIVNDKKYKGQKVFFREGSKNRISQTESLSNMIQVSWQCVPFVLAENDPQSDSGVVVTWGTYYNGRGVQAPVMPGGLGLMIMVIGTTIKQMSEGPGVSRYLYVRGSAKDEFQIVNAEAVDIVRNRIDLFEMANLKDDFTRNGYYQASESILGAYLDEANSELWLVEF